MSFFHLLRNTVLGRSSVRMLLYLALIGCLVVNFSCADNKRVQGSSTAGILHIIVLQENAGLHEIMSVPRSTDADQLHTQLIDYLDRAPEECTIELRIQYCSGSQVPESLAGIRQASPAYSRYEIRKTESSYSFVNILESREGHEVLSGFPLEHKTGFIWTVARHIVDWSASMQ